MWIITCGDSTSPARGIVPLHGRPYNGTSLETVRGEYLFVQVYRSVLIRFRHCKIWRLYTTFFYGLRSEFMSHKYCGAVSLEQPATVPRIAYLFDFFML